MIWKPISLISPPHGRIDGLIYWGALAMPDGPVWYILSDNKLQYWDGSAWVDVILAGYVAFYSASAAPAGAVDGDWWYDTVNAQLSVRLLSAWELIWPAVVPRLPEAGTGNLDLAGSLAVNTTTSPTVLVACFGAGGASGSLFVTQSGPDSWAIASTAGALDALLAVRWIAY